MNHLLILATAIEAAPFTLVGDVPPVVAAHVPAWVLYVAPAAALFVYSLLVGALNQVIRQRDAEGVPVSPRLRFVAAVLNAAAANLDKSREQVGKAKVTP